MLLVLLVLVGLVFAEPQSCQYSNPLWKETFKLSFDCPGCSDRGRSLRQQAGDSGTEYAACHGNYCGHEAVCPRADYLEEVSDDGKQHEELPLCKGEDTHNGMDAVCLNHDTCYDQFGCSCECDYWLCQKLQANSEIYWSEECEVFSQTNHKWQFIQQLRAFFCAPTARCTCVGHNSQVMPYQECMTLHMVNDFAPFTTYDRLSKQLITKKPLNPSITSFQSYYTKRSVFADEPAHIMNDSEVLEDLMQEEFEFFLYYCLSPTDQLRDACRHAHEALYLYNVTNLVSPKEVGGRYEKAVLTSTVVLSITVALLLVVILIMAWRLWALSSASSSGDAYVPM